MYIIFPYFCPETKIVSERVVGLSYESVAIRHFRVSLTPRIHCLSLCIDIGYMARYTGSSPTLGINHTHGTPLTVYKLNLVYAQVKKRPLSILIRDQTCGVSRSRKRVQNGRGNTFVRRKSIDP